MELMHPKGDFWKTYKADKTYGENIHSLVYWTIGSRETSNRKALIFYVKAVLYDWIQVREELENWLGGELPDRDAIQAVSMQIDLWTAILKEESSEDRLVYNFDLERLKKEFKSNG